MNTGGDVYRHQVAPVLEAHRAPVPTPVLAGAAGAVAVGALLLVALPLPTNAVGLVPLVAVGFGAWAVNQNRTAATTGHCVVREGQVLDRRTETIVTDRVGTDFSEGRTVYIVEARLRRQGHLDETGVHWTPTDDTVRLTVDEPTYTRCEPGSALVGLSLPTAPNHVFTRLDPVPAD